MILDTIEFWFLVYAFDGARYLLGAGLVSLVLYVMCKGFSESRRIQRRRASWADIKREILFSAITVGVYATVALVIVRMEQAGILQVYMGWDEYGYLYAALSLPLVLVLHDAYFYWVHRMMHHPVLFERFHRLHHRSRTPTPWAAYAFAPGEAVLMSGFVPLLTLFIPIHGTVLFVFLAIMILRNAMGHSGVEFHPRGWVDGPLDVFNTVTHHDLHHQRVRGNYGLYFTWWDRWMGTEFSDYKEQFREAASTDSREDFVAVSPLAMALNVKSES